MNYYYDAVEMMDRFGGSFAQAIGKAWIVADPMNKSILEEAFRDLFERYKERAKVWGNGVM